MQWTVTWHRDAQDDLMRIWLAATDRDAVTAAANLIDRELAVDPMSKGEDFYGDRLLVVVPIAIGFVVREGDNLVEVRQIWRAGTSA